jgi:P4 family phage/plasmid primase-like protien
MGIQQPNETLQVALGYIQRGWNPLPIPFRTKVPIDDRWQQRVIDAATVAQHFNGQPNVGVILGPTSRGLTDVDLDCSEAIAVAPYLLLRTSAIFGRPDKRNSHFLYYTELSSASEARASIKFTAPDKKVLCELRIGGGKGAQTVFPPSVHESGELIAWEPDCDGEPAKADGDVLLKLVQQVAAAALLARHWPTAQGSRHDTALIVGGFLARCGFSEIEAKTLVEATTKAAGDPEWRDRVIAARDAVRQHRDNGRHFGFPALVETFGKAVATKVAKWLGADDCERIAVSTPGADATPTNEAPRFSEESIALHFAGERAGDTRYVAAWSKWLRYDGSRWAADETVATFDAVRATCRAVASAINKASMRRTIASAKTVAAVERLARSDRRLAATVEQWDADIWLLNTPQGVIDLRTGKMRKHRPEDYLMRMTTVAPDGACPLWHSFLDDVTAGDEALQQYLQRMGGYFVTGSTREHALFFLYGTGANGKTTFLNAIAGILGDYHRTAPIETFVASHTDKHPTDLAGLQGARLVTATETEEGRRWAESKIKMLTGGDQITARFMRQDFFDYIPQFKLGISGNHKPGLRSVDEAMRRRFNLLPFTVTIPPDKRDEELGEKLKAEWPGILQWMIEGCLAWQKCGLAPPKAVTAATETYFEAQDSVAAWLEDCCELDANAWEGSPTLFASWKTYADAAGVYVGDIKTFRDRLEHRDGIIFKKNPTSRRNGFLGVRLKQQPEDPYYANRYHW